MIRRLCGVMMALVLVGVLSAAPARSEALASWNDGPSKSAITDFVSRVTTKGSPDFVEPAQRIAVFDNDGTLWAEQPMYFRLAPLRIMPVHRSVTRILSWRGRGRVRP